MTIDTRRSQARRTCEFLSSTERNFQEKAGLEAREWVRSTGSKSLSSNPQQLDVAMCTLTPLQWAVGTGGLMGLAGRQSSSEVNERILSQ